MVLERPWLLVLLAVIPAAIWLTSLSAARLSPIRLGLATLLRLVGLTAIVLAMAGFAFGRDSRPATVFVVDTSDSVLLAERANAHAIIDSFVRAFGPTHLWGSSNSVRAPRCWPRPSAWTKPHRYAPSFPEATATMRRGF